MRFTAPSHSLKAGARNWFLLLHQLFLKPKRRQSGFSAFKVQRKDHTITTVAHLPKEMPKNTCVEVFSYVWFKKIALKDDYSGLHQGVFTSLAQRKRHTNTRVPPLPLEIPQTHIRKPCHTDVFRDRNL